MNWFSRWTGANEGLENPTAVITNWVAITIVAVWMSGGAYYKTYQNRYTCS